MRPSKEEIASLLARFDQSNWDEMDLKIGDFRLRLSNDAITTAPAATAPAPLAVRPPAAASRPAPARGPPAARRPRRRRREGGERGREERRARRPSCGSRAEPRAL